MINMKYPRAVDILTNSVGPRIEYAHWNPEKAGLYTVPEGMKIFRYKCVWNKNGRNGERESFVCCYSRADFETLVGWWDSWNPSEYRYTTLDEVV